MKTKDQPLKARIAAGEVTLGSWVMTGSSTVAEIMAHSGFDWLVIDLEHTVTDLAETQDIIRAIDSACIPAICRLTSLDVNQIKRVMDAGASGVMVPNIRSAAEAKQAVDAVYYPPRGTRGVGLFRAQSYGAPGAFEAYKKRLDAEGLVIVMIEHVDAIQEIDAILAVDGVDAWIVGPYDLTGSLGDPGNFDMPAFAEALAAILEAGKRAGKQGGIHVVETDQAQLQARIDQGFRFLGYGVDTRILDSVCRSHLAAIRSSDLK
ncbi:MAG: HpcH/HpaI aldolase family protein [Rhodospirillales bacterium]